jgi:protein ImuB
MVACVLIPRFELAVAAGGLEPLAGRAVAIAPERGSGPIGEVSGAAQAFGVRIGMALGEALARCPALELLDADPIAVAAAWERTLRALEEIGAGVEPARPGLACFTLDGLRGLYGGSDELVLVAARRALDRPARLAAAPTRFCALAGALATRPRRTLIVRESARAHLAPLPVALLRSRGSGSRRWASSRHSPAPPSPTASARPGSRRTDLPAARIIRPARGESRLRCGSRSSCPRRPAVRLSSARSRC